MKYKNKSVILAAIIFIAVIFSSCSFNGGISVGNYVNSVGDCMHDTVNLTRELKKIQDSKDTRSPDDAKIYNETLDKLADLYAKLITLEAPDRYDDIDDDIKSNAKTVLSDISQIQELISVSQSTGDDTLYKMELPDIMEEYTKSYNELSDLSNQALTRYRND